MSQEKTLGKYRFYILGENTLGTPKYFVSFLYGDVMKINYLLALFIFPFLQSNPSNTGTEGSVIEINRPNYSSDEGIGRIWFVKEGLSGNGGNWDKAFGNLQDALKVAKKDDEIWVAAGKYLPTQDNDRKARFHIKDGITVLGGFSGTETNPNQRNHRKNLTILSGDIGAETPLDNSFTVVYFSNVSSSTVLDGFVIADGEAKGGLSILGDPYDCGGGIFIEGNGQSSNPVIKNCRLVNNYAFYGGGIFSYPSNKGSCGPTIINTEFEMNMADLDGGAIYNYGLDGHSFPTIKNSRFIRNQANYGAVIFTKYSDCVDTPEMINCQFKYNVAYTRGPVYYDQFLTESSCNTKITASIYSENKSSLGLPEKEGKKAIRKRASYRSGNQ